MRKIAIILTCLFLLATHAWAGVPKKGDLAPDFSLTSVTGEKVSLSDLKGKVVLVGMFHICVPCMNQAMEFEKVKKSLNSDKLAVIGINTSGDTKAAVLDYLSQFPNKVSFPYLLDPDTSIHQHYIQRDMPTVLVIDDKGVIQARSPGVGAGQLIPFIKKLL